MNGGICVCVLLAALSTSCFGHPTSNSEDKNRAISSHAETVLSKHVRQSRSTNFIDQPNASSEEGVDSLSSLTELLAKLISTTGNIRRNSTKNSRASGLSANHRMKDRDYVGWMDFGRRNTKEYEYSSEITSTP